ncbi:hypothetical protein [Caballeronia sp. LZ034LL]|uniref:hypothetical protein n=1 Tax=Caballeronia sp. LZ034LL TaxID=3038567 RepID=UPI002859E1C9|nr:hypothetical protein [Caballeronia sp. LZ034LL]MDR5839389.1 hypothetical protein [Caballeronia sp. LZ034LL]
MMDSGKNWNKTLSPVRTLARNGGPTFFLSPMFCPTLKRAAQLPFRYNSRRFA